MWEFEDGVDVILFSSPLKIELYYCRNTQIDTILSFPFHTKMLYLAYLFAKRPKGIDPLLWQPGVFILVNDQLNAQILVL